MLRHRDDGERAGYAMADANTSGVEMGFPTLVVHGLLDDARRIEPLCKGLRAHGIRQVHSFDMRPSDGRAPIARLSEQVRQEAARLRARHGCERIDIVGFSMGALVSRYFLQRQGGKSFVRRFVSIAGPHAGTLTAHLLPLPGGRDMRPGSRLLRDLAQDEYPFGDVEVHSIYSRYDLMVFPARTALLAGGRTSHEIPVLVHRLLVHDVRVHACVAKVLLTP
jgi:triacylglycerol lipase